MRTSFSVSRHSELGRALRDCHLIVIGLPIALVIAWAFEATPEGIKRTAVADAARESFTRQGLDLRSHRRRASLDRLVFSRALHRWKATPRHDASPARTEAAKQLRKNRSRSCHCLTKAGSARRIFFRRAVGGTDRSLGANQRPQGHRPQFFLSFQRQERGTENNRREAGCKHASGRHCAKAGGQSANCRRTD